MTHSDLGQRRALHAASVGTWEFDVLAGTIVLDDNLLGDIGIDPAKLDGRIETWVDRFHPDDRAAVLRLGEEAIRDRAQIAHEFRVRRDDGAYGWIRLPRRGGSRRGGRGDPAGQHDVEYAQDSGNFVPIPGVDGAAKVFEEQAVLDIVVNNAGIGHSGTFLDTTEKKWDRVLDLNLWGVIHGCRAFGAMRRSAARAGTSSTGPRPVRH